MKTYIVQGWLNNSDYDAGKPANITDKIVAIDQSRAEDIADEQFERAIGKCETIDSVVAPK